jgi:hypothetical protein
MQELLFRYTINSKNDKLHGKLEKAANDLKIIEKGIVATTNKI